MMPVFQELCMLLDDYWERMDLKVPIYFSAGMCGFLNVVLVLFCCM
jgi:integrator complex subunit 11